MYNLYESIIPGYAQERNSRLEAYEELGKRNSKKEAKSELKNTIQTLK